MLFEFLRLSVPSFRLIEFQAIDVAVDNLGNPFQIGREHKLALRRFREADHVLVSDLRKQRRFIGLLDYRHGNRIHTISKEIDISVLSDSDAGLQILYKTPRKQHCENRQCNQLSSFHI